MNENGRNALAAIAGILLLTSWALYLGYDGALFLAAVGIMSGLGGYPILQELKAWYDVKTVKGFLKQAGK